jgi:hypothetical protein
MPVFPCKSKVAVPKAEVLEQPQFSTKIFFENLGAFFAVSPQKTGLSGAPLRSGPAYGVAAPHPSNPLCGP